MSCLARIPLEYKLERTEVKSSDSMALAQWREDNTCMKWLQLAVKHNVVLCRTYRRWWFEQTGMAHCYHGDGQRIPILPYLCFCGRASAFTTLGVFCERVVMFRSYLLDHNLSRVLLTICFNVLKLHVNLAPSLLPKLVTDSLLARLEVGPMTWHWTGYVTHSAFCPIPLDWESSLLCVFPEKLVSLLLRVKKTCQPLGPAPPARLAPANKSEADWVVSSWGTLTEQVKN